MLRISRDLTIDENDIQIGFVRASGRADRTSTSSRPRRNCVRYRPIAWPTMPGHGSTGSPASA